MAVNKAMFEVITHKFNFKYTSLKEGVSMLIQEFNLYGVLIKCLSRNVQKKIMPGTLLINQIFNFLLWNENRLFPIYLYNFV